MKCHDCGKEIKDKVFYLYLRDINRASVLHRKCFVIHVNEFLASIGKSQIGFEE